VKSASSRKRSNTYPEGAVIEDLLVARPGALQPMVGYGETLWLHGMGSLMQHTRIPVLAHIA
jgi:hypothetical protein